MVGFSLNPVECDMLPHQRPAFLRVPVCLSTKSLSLHHDQPINPMVKMGKKNIQFLHQFEMIPLQVVFHGGYIMVYTIIPFHSHGISMIYTIGIIHINWRNYAIRSLSIIPYQIIPYPNWMIGIFVSNGFDSISFPKYHSHDISNWWDSQIRSSHSFQIIPSISLDIIPV